MRIPEEAVVPFALIGFPLFWCFVLLFLAQTGWKPAARRFRAGIKPEGTSIRGVSGRFQPLGTAYNGCLNLIFSQQGIYIAPVIIFRPGHPPLLLPWECVSRVEERAGWFGKKSLIVTLALQNERSLVLLLPAKAKPVLSEFLEPAGE